MGHDVQFSNDLSAAFTRAPERTAKEMSTSNVINAETFLVP